MSNDEEDRKEPQEAAEHLKRIEKHLAEEDKQLEHLDAHIRKAEKKSKHVVPDPEY
jgi:hypothetical protein